MIGIEGKNKYYFNIAGFTLCLNYHDTPWIKIKERLKSDIYDFLRSFYLNEKPKKVDYQIDFIWDKYSNIKFYVEKDDFENYYVNYLLVKSKRRAVSFYRISLTEFNIILRFVLAYLLRINKGFSMHASAVINNGKVDIFLGRSGAGKSTARQLLDQDYPSLADDSIIIKKESKSYFVYQSPFLEGKVGLKKSSNKYLLSRVFILKKSKNFGLKTLVNKEQLIKIITKQLIFDNKKSLLKQEMEIAMKFISEFSHFYQLNFSKDRQGLLNLLKSNNN